MQGKVIGHGKPFKGEKSKRSGNPYHGQNVTVSYTKRRYEGVTAVNEYVNFVDVPNPVYFQLGDVVTLDYDSEGNLIEIKHLTQGKQADNKALNFNVKGAAQQPS